MLSPSAIFKKTDAGVTEVNARALGLRAALRRTLIMIDGRNTLAALATIVRGEEVEGLIYELQSLGLIDTGGGTATRAAGDLRSAVIPVPAQPVLAPLAVPQETAPGEPTQEQLVGARRAAVRALNDILGPGADSFAIRIEKCRTPNELREQVVQIRQTLARSIGESAAVRFVEAVRDGGRA
jgi:hypothetical protein